MATGGFSSHGTILSAGDGVQQGETFTAIAEVLDISGPGTTLNTEDATNHDSAGWREVVPTVLEGGELTFDINYYADSTQTALRTDQENGTRRNFKITFPFGTPETLAFAGIVTGFEYSAPVEGIVRASVTILVTGDIS